MKTNRSDLRAPFILALIVITATQVTSALVIWQTGSEYAETASYVPLYVAGAIVCGMFFEAAIIYLWVTAAKPRPTPADVWILGGLVVGGLATLLLGVLILLFVIEVGGPMVLISSVLLGLAIIAALLATRHGARRAQENLDYVDRLEADVEGLV